LGSAEPAVLPLDYGWLDCDGALVFVERKEVSNLLTDLRNGHLRDQLENARGQTEQVWLLVERLPVVMRGGEINGPGAWTYKAFWSALISLMYGLGIGGPLWSADMQGTVEILRAFFAQSQREALGSGRPKLSKWRDTVRGSRAEAYARAIFGLGQMRAERLAARFPTWSALVGAEPAELRMEGIGPGWAERIWAALH